MRSPATAPLAVAVALAIAALIGSSAAEGAPPASLVIYSKAR
ncbi:hypothetical protein FHW58_003428 [Duganella sp. 1224]|nr:hypothetical protein [Duganella sp. 1224]NYE62213.1 hypothetical protein [Duganella sp. 1224]